MEIMVTAKVFQSGNSQAIRIPKEYQTRKTEFFIRKLGECFYLTPVDDPWYLVRNSIGKADAEADILRDQPSLEEMPEREGF